MTRLAFVVPGRIDQLTGGYLFDRRLVEGLHERGRDPALFELEGRFPEVCPSAIEAAGACLAGLPDGSIVVIDGLALPAFTGCLAEQALRLRIVGFVHHPLYLETGLNESQGAGLRVLEERLWSVLSGVICASAHSARAVIEAGVPGDRVRVASPGVARQTLSTAPRAPGAWRLLTVGTVTPRKGHLLLAQALSGLRDLDWQWCCIGSLQRDAGTVAALRQLIADRALGDRVRLLGEQSAQSLASAYREADLFVLPSYHEGYGMVLTEALSYGLPIVSTRAGAIPDTVPAEAALLVEPGDGPALAEALRGILGNDSLHSRLVSGARRAAPGLVDWPQAVDRWVRSLDALTA